MSFSSSSWSSFEDEKTISKKKMNAKCIQRLAFGLELLSGIFIIIIAAYLRISDLHPNTQNINWKILCSDSSLFETEPPPLSFNPLLLYAIILVIPAVFILLGELEYSLFSKVSYFQNQSKFKRLIKNFPRTGSIFAMFILGTMMTSLTADYLKILIIQPRPYFLSVYGGNCPFAYNGTGTYSDQFFDALKSFPSHLAAEAGFCCSFAVGYAHMIHSMNRMPVLLPVVSQFFLIVAATVSLDHYTSHFSHLSDIAAGLLIGIAFGLYMSYFVSSALKPKTRHEVEESSCPHVFGFTIPRVTWPSAVTAGALNSPNLKTK